jgi:HD-GYP domain-containing protein (c-di-GMP phosphodiesterase class II)
MECTHTIMNSIALTDWRKFMNKRAYAILTKMYIVIVAVCIIPMIYFTKDSIRLKNLPEMAFWIILVTITECRPIFINEVDETNEITLSFAVHLASIFILGIEKTILIGIVSTLFAETILKKPWYKRIFNTGQYAITLAICGHLYYLLKISPNRHLINIVLDMPAILICSTAYIAINSIMISIIIYLTTNDKFLDTLFLDIKVIIGYFYALVPISIAIAFIYDPKYPFTIMIMIPPVLLMEQSVRRFYKLRTEAKSTLAALADIIDKRDKYTYDHSARVAMYSKEISEQLDLSTNEVSRIEMAGLVHDLGKISIEDSIIKKNDKLTSDEYNIIKGHPETAYHLLRNIKSFEKSAEYVLCHHERFSGGGYPNNISHENIPLGARILTVADSYDAMTSDRLYRSAMTPRKAVDELIKNSGTQFDPVVVEAFIEILKNNYDYTEGE